MEVAVRRGGRIFYGWWVVLASVVGLLLSVAPVFSFTLGVFIKPLSQEFSWSRAEISLGYALCTLLLSGVTPLVGRLVDRYSARRIVVPSLFIFGLCLTSFYFLSASIWHLYASYLLIGLIGSGSTLG
jgi:MFS family permease